MKGAQSQTSPRFNWLRSCVAVHNKCFLSKIQAHSWKHIQVLLSSINRCQVIVFSRLDQIMCSTIVQTTLKLKWVWLGKVSLTAVQKKNMGFSLWRAAQWPNHARMNLTEVTKRYWGETPVTKWWLGLVCDVRLIDCSFNWDNWSNGRPIRSHHFVDVRLPRTCSHKANLRKWRC